MFRSLFFMSTALLALTPTPRQSPSPSPSPSPSQSPARADLKAAIDSLLDSRVAADEFSGAVAVAKNGQIVYQRAAGIANRESGAPMTIDTRMQIASMTKLFTQIAIRQLEQAGKLSLGDTVGKFLPKYPNPVVRSKVTIEQLLRHRSGVGSFWNERYMARRADVRSVNDYLELFQNDSLLFEPGTNEAYSNGGYVLLGAIIERVSGKSYHDYLRANVFAPAGMTSTSPYDRRVPLANAAVGYTTQAFGGPMPGDRRLAGPAGPRSASAAAAPSGGDAPRLRIMGADGRQLSPEEAREAMARRAARGGVRKSNANIQPGMSGPAGDHYSTVGDFLRLANAITSRRLLDSAHTAALLGARYSSGTDFRSNGGGPGVNAEFSIYPSGDVMVALSNFDPPSATSVAQYIRSLIAPPVATAPKAGPATASPNPKL